MRLTTYLLCDGNCKDVMAFYHTVFGGDLTLTTVGDSPMKDAFPASMHAGVVSARLKSQVVDISASDWLRPAEKRIRGNAVCLYLSGGIQTKRNRYSAGCRRAPTSPIRSAYSLSACTAP